MLTEGLLHAMIPFAFPHLNSTEQVSGANYGVGNWDVQAGVLNMRKLLSQCSLWVCVSWHLLCSGEGWNCIFLLTGLWDCNTVVQVPAACILTLAAKIK